MMHEDLKNYSTYYCKKCEDGAESWRDLNFHKNSGICSKHNIPLVEYKEEDVVSDLKEMLAVLRLGEVNEL